MSPTASSSTYGVFTLSYSDNWSGAVLYVAAEMYSSSRTGTAAAVTAPFYGAALSAIA